jgi:hypothetical protein
LKLVDLGLAVYTAYSPQMNLRIQTKAKVIGLKLKFNAKALRRKEVYEFIDLFPP